MPSNEDLLLELRSLKQRVAEIEQQLCSSKSADRASSSTKENKTSKFQQGMSTTSSCNCFCFEVTSSAIGSAHSCGHTAKIMLLVQHTQRK
jgi:hypothetical protein